MSFDAEWLAEAAEDAASAEDWDSMVRVLEARDVEADRAALRRLTARCMEATGQDDPFLVREAARRVVGSLRGRRLRTSYRPPRG